MAVEPAIQVVSGPAAQAAAAQAAQAQRMHPAQAQHTTVNAVQHHSQVVGSSRTASPPHTPTHPFITGQTCTGPACGSTTQGAASCSELPAVATAASMAE